MKVTRRQLKLLVKEASSPGELSILTESELHEIAPIILGMFRGLGSVAAKTFTSLAKKGAQGVGQYLMKNPKAAQSVTALISKSKDKLPGVKKFVDEMLGGKLDPATVAVAMQNIPKDVEADLNSMMKSAGQEIAKAEECECPTAKEQQSMMGKLASFFT